MTAKPRRIGTLKFAAPVTISSERIAINASGRTRIRNQLTILAHALRAFGSFRLDRHLLPCAGAFAVDVLAGESTGDATFDNDAFGAFLHQLNQAIAVVSTSDHDGADLAAAAESLACGTGRDPTLIVRLFEALQHQDAITVIDDHGKEINLASPLPPAPQDEATIDVDVAEVRRLIRVDTGINSYVVEASTEANVRRGDRIQAIDAGPAGGMRCIAADAAMTIPHAPPPGLFD